MSFFMISFMHSTIRLTSCKESKDVKVDNPKPTASVNPEAP